MTAFDSLRDVFWADEPEPLAAAHYRRAFPPILWVCPLLLVTSIGGRYATPGPGFDPRAYDLFIILNAIGPLGGMAVSALMRRSESVPRLRAAACLMVAFFSWGNAIGMWMGGDESSLAVFMFSLVIAIWRGWYDAKIGLFALVSSAVAVCSLKTLQIMGAVRANAAYPAHASIIRGGASSVISAMVWDVVLFGIAFVGVSYVANRARAGDRAAEQERRERRLLEVKLAERELGRLSGSLIAGSYELLELLGRGAMGEVYAAKRLGTGEAVAIKVLHTQHGSAPEVIERFRREAEALGRLPAAHVPQTYDFGTTEDGDHFIVMDHLRGEDLASFLRRRGFLSAGEVARLTSAIAPALEAAHDAGLVHRDLKPQNVFLVEGAEFDVRLLDFGVSRWMEAEEQHGLTRTSMVIGSPGYLAPEQATGTLEQVGAHTDVFALGTIVYRALTGENAFPSRNAAAAVYEAVHHEPPAPSTRRPLHEDVDIVVALALAKNVAHRYGRAKEFAHDLELAVEGKLPELVRTRGRSLPRATARALTASGTQAKVA